MLSEVQELAGALLPMSEALIRCDSTVGMIIFRMGRSYRYDIMVRFIYSSLVSKSISLA